MRALPTATLLALLLTWAPQRALGELGDTESRARAHDTRGAELFEAEDYEGALVELEAAHQLLPATPRLFNIALCHERLDNVTEALGLYQRFVEAPDAPEVRRQSAQEHIDALRERLALPTRSEPPSEDTAEAEPPSEDTAEAEPPPTPPSPDPPPGAVEAVGRRRLAPRAFWALLATTLAVSVASIVTGSVALHWQSEFEATLAGSSEGRAARDQGWPLAVTTDVLIATELTLALSTLVVGLLTRFGHRRRAQRGE